MPFCVAKSAELPVRELLEGVQSIVGSAVTMRLAYHLRLLRRNGLRIPLHRM